MSLRVFPFPCILYRISGSVFMKFLYFLKWDEQMLVFCCVKSCQCRCALTTKKMSATETVISGVIFCQYCCAASCCRYFLPSITDLWAASSRIHVKFWLWGNILSIFKLKNSFNFKFFTVEHYPVCQDYLIREYGFYIWQLKVLVKSNRMFFRCCCEGRYTHFLFNETAADAHWWLVCPQATSVGQSQETLLFGLRVACLTSVFIGNVYPSRGKWHFVRIWEEQYLLFTYLVGMFGWAVNNTFLCDVTNLELRFILFNSSVKVATCRIYWHPEWELLPTHQPKSWKLQFS